MTSHSTICPLDAGGGLMLEMVLQARACSMNFMHTIRYLAHGLHVQSSLPT